MAASALLQAGQRSAAITREALKIGTCYFCVGALLGVRQPTFYALPSSEAHSGLAEYLDAVSIPAQGAQPLQQQDTKTTCPVCLGILQHHDLQHDATCANKTSPRPAGAAAAEPAAHAGSGTPNSPAVALANAIRSKHYDSRRFFIGVRVPTSVAMRQHALRYVSRLPLPDAAPASCTTRVPLQCICVQPTGLGCNAGANALS